MTATGEGPQEAAVAAAGLELDDLGIGVVPRILLATDGTLTHILEAWAAEPVQLVKLSHALVTDEAVRASLSLDDGERALRRIILLRGAVSGTTFIYAESVVMLDRLPPPVADGLLETDIPIGKLLYSCRAETFREITAIGEERNLSVARHFGLDAATPLVSRAYRIVFGTRPISRITEVFPKTWFSDL